MLKKAADGMTGFWRIVMPPLHQVALRANIRRFPTTECSRQGFPKPATLTRHHAFSACCCMIAPSKYQHSFDPVSASMVHIEIAKEIIQDHRWSNNRAAVPLRSASTEIIHPIRSHVFDLCAIPLIFPAHPFNLDVSNGLEAAQSF